MKLRKLSSFLRGKGNEKCGISRSLALSLCMLTFAGAYAQTGKINIQLNNAPVKTLFSTIEKQTNYRFSYRDADIAGKQNVTVSAENKELKDLLIQELAKRNLTYKMSGNVIMVLPAQQPGTSAGPDKKITGVVKDANGEPIIGANVTVKGQSSIGTITDIDGRFTLDVPAGAVLQVSFIGFASQDIEVGNQKELAIALKEDTEMLDEVVVVGYGTQKKVNLTGAVESVKSGDLEKVSVINTVSSLAGKLPGLYLKQNSGKPGDNEPSLNIRGFGAPLIIIDGTEQGSFGNLDSEEIESVNILKDASAAVYGARAGNGVILVTTKRGKSSKPRVSFNASLSWSRVTKYPKLMNAGQYAELYNEAQLNDGIAPENLKFTEEAINHYKLQDDPIHYPNTNWFDTATRKFAPQQKYNFNIGGGNDVVRYYVSLGYAHEEGLWKSGDSDFKRYNFRSNIDVKVTPHLTASLDLSGRRENRSDPFISVSDIFLNILRSQPTLPSSYPDPTKHVGRGSAGANGLISTQKDVVGYVNDERHYFTGTFKLRYDFPFLKNLYAEGRMTYYKDGIYKKTWEQQYGTYNYDAENDMYTLISENGRNALTEAQDHTKRTTYQVSLNYENVFGNHDVKGLFLFEGMTDSGNNFWGNRIDYISNAVQQLFAGGTENQSTDGTAWESGRASFIGRLNYIYSSKYLLEATFRYDGSPKFAKEHRWGFFPSVSLGWILSNEQFMSGFSNLDNLKLRVSYSNTGNDDTGAFQYLTGYNFTGNYIIGGTSYKTISTTGLINPLITWEDMHTFNVGIDASFFGCINASFDMFYRKRLGILANRYGSVPNTFGAILPAENINSQDNRGFEFSLGYRKRIGSVDVNLMGNVSYSRAKWIHFEEAEYTDVDQIRINKKSGHWVDERYGYITDGFFESEEQIKNWPINQDGTGNTTLKPGDLIYKDLNNDKIIDWRDQDLVGRGDMPTLYYGLNLDLTWKNFNLNMVWQGAAGYNFEIVSDAKSTFTQDQNGYEYFYTNRWTPDNKNAKYPRASIGLPANQDKFSDFWYKKAAYLRLKSLMVSYNFPKKMLSKYNLPDIQLYLAGTNLLTFDSLSDFGYDPEAPNWNNGLYYPQQSTITVGIKLNL